MVKTSMGRQKIEIKKINKENTRQVTFSKRRTGLFKKASELCILCGAEIAIIVFSPAGKAFSFGHPSVDSVVDRFLTRNSALPDHTNAPSLVDARHGASVCMEVFNQLEDEKKREARLKQSKKVSNAQFWWEAPMDNLSLNELEQLMVSIEELKKNVVKRIDKLSLSSGVVDGRDTHMVPHGYGSGC
ncbi:hypothetical protein HHK36_009689 [Tetracentron sinense]|uniref:MADS-box domain-containing protein n=1 Tax=Tetracentron sinense TaxID=13715 RepID=A0A834ZG27_TETSI|nr:hypothetical protein HHK36_009689 [Tetracentron sinense]